MPRLEPVKHEEAQGKAKELLDGVNDKFGKVPNIFSHMAASPAVLQYYLDSSGALAEGSLPQELREQIALVVGQYNQCGYCLAAHTAIGKMAGLDQDEMLKNRQGEASDDKAGAALAFVRKAVDTRANVSDSDIQALRDAGFSDGDIAEIVANIALNLFTNYFNHIAGTEVDFPAAPDLS